MFVFSWLHKIATGAEWLGSESAWLMRASTRRDREVSEKWCFWRMDRI